MKNYLGLRHRIRVQLDLAEVITRRDVLEVVGPGAGIEVRSVDRLRPDPDRVEGEEARLARPFDVTHGRGVCDLPADGSGP